MDAKPFQVWVFEGDGRVELCDEFDDLESAKGCAQNASHWTGVERCEVHSWPKGDILFCAKADAAIPSPLEHEHSVARLRRQVFRCRHAPRHRQRH